MLQIKRLILSRPDRIGDVIISSSCLSPIKQAFPHLKVYFLARDAMRPLFEKHQALAGFLSLPDSHCNFYHRICAIGQLFKVIRPEVVIHLQPDRACYLSAALSGIPMRIGFEEAGWSWLLSNRFAYRKSEGLKHEAEYNFDLFAPLGLEKPSQFRAEIDLDEQWESRMQEKLPWKMQHEAYAVLNLSAFSKAARWPATCFAKLAEWFLRNKELKVVLIGDSDQDASLREFEKEVGASREIYNLAGRTNLAELGWLLKHARVLVTRDTGPSHLAAAVGCPVVVLFGRTAPIYGPTRWRPLSEKVIVVSKSLAPQRWESHHSHWQRCFAAITTEEVCEAAETALRLA